jgi:hypothetical protein
MDLIQCPHCETRVFASSDGECPACRKPLDAPKYATNPYAPPEASLDPEAGFREVSPVVQTTVFQKFGEAFHILAADLFVIGPLILTVWLPGNLFVNYLIYSSPALDNGLALMRLNNLIESVFGPVYAGGVIYVLSKRKEGQRVTYREAIGVGLARWGSLFGARFFTGLIILLGCIAFLIPGIVLATRYALLDSVVVLEGANGPAARRRSAELTAGKKGQIFVAGCLFFIGYIPAYIAVGILTESFEPLQNMWASTFLDCVMDIFLAIIVIVLFLFYWESAHREDAVTGEDDFLPGMRLDFRD